MKIWLRKTVTSVTILAFLQSSIGTALAMPIASLRAPELPAVQAEGPAPTEAANYQLAFDGLASTAFASSQKTVIEYPLDARQSIQSLRILDAAPFVLSVEYWDGQAWSRISNWTGLNLTQQADGWTGIELQRAVDTDRLRLTLEPRAGASTGLKEIEFWTADGADALTSGVVATSQALAASGTLPGQFRSYPATLGEGWIGVWPEQPSDNPADNQFTVNLNLAPAAIKRAWLVYELYGLQDHAAVSRSINDQLAVGGYLIQKGTTWNSQKEAVNPAWLRAGDNHIRFTLPDNAPYGYKIRNLKLVLEKHTGTQLLAALRSTGPASALAARLFDGQNNTAITLAQLQGVTVPAAAPVASTATPAAPRRGGLNAVAASLQAGQTLPGTTLSDGRIFAGQSSAASQPAAQADSAWTRTRHSSNELLPGCQEAYCQEVLTEGTVEASLDDWTVLEQLSLFAAGNGLAHVDVQALTSTGWVRVGNNQRVMAGWNSIDFARQPAIKALRLHFDRLPAQISVGELRLQGHAVRGTVARDLVLTSPVTGNYYSDKAYLKGFVAGNNASAAQLMVGSQKIKTTNGEFEVLVRKPATATASWSVGVTAIYPDGQVIRQNVVLSNPQALDFERTLTPAGSTQSTPVAGTLPQIITVEGASLEIEKGAVQNKTLSITPLRDVDLPALDAGMINVTKTHKGYRFLPHGRFQKKIKVRIGYDKTKLPAGYTEADIKTFFFDDATGRWVALETADIDIAKGEVVANTDHFTDMITAVLQVPDNPETQSYTPTQLKDIKAADPGAGINLIDVPEASAMGDANLGYPIQLPPGRQGVQPGLRIGYSSGGGNGWLGQGWNLQLPSVGIDTRWGVPRYDAALETETYVLGGEQLTPLAHREALRPRTANKDDFHTRVEGAFQRIKRHGDTPNNYWWEVTTKDGSKSFYGGLPGQGQQAAAVLTDASGHAAHWALTEQRDTNGNFVRYHYAKIQDAGVGNGQGGVPGYQLYIQRITYTGSGSTEGAYSVEFQRDRDLAETRRPDVSIDARLGFKQVTADLLRKINVKFKNQPVRSYELVYQQGAFAKTLLKEVKQYGADGSLFNAHAFEYFDEARTTNGTYKGFAANTSWEAGPDTVSAGLFGKGVASVLGGTKSQSTGGHLYVGVGPGAEIFRKNNSAGFKIGYSKSKSEGLVALTDINGDGLPDKVLKRDGGFIYRPNISGPAGESKFGAALALASFPGISREKVTSTTIGAESYFGVPVLYDRNRAITEADTYLSDVNADGITDVVRGGRAYFGYIASNGSVAYSQNSSATPVPVGQGAIDTNNLLEDAADIEAERAANFPLLDTMRRWVAPYDGVVSINAPVKLIQDMSAERAEYDGADGVRVAVQLEGNELWSADVAATDYAEKIPAGLTAIPVSKGDRIYFRVQSKFDGAYDQVSWDPEIAYQSVDVTKKDVNGLNEYRYKASQDFTLAGRRGTVSMPVNGTLHIGGVWKKTGVTTDDVTLLITRNGQDVYRRTLGYADIQTVNLSQDVTVASMDEMEWRILADSPVDAGKISLEPVAYYTAAEGVESVTDEDGNYVLQAYPSYDIDLYVTNNYSAPQGTYTAASAVNLPVNARFQVSGLADGQRMEAVFTIKKPNGLLKKHPLVFVGTGNNMVPVELALTDVLSLQAGDRVFFDLSSRNPAFADQVTLVDVTVGSGSTPAPVAVGIHVPSRDTLFAQPYRGWGVAGYNGNSPRDAMPIDQQLLVINQNYDPNNARVYSFTARPNESLWGGVDELAWIKAAGSSSSRLGLDDIRMPTSARFAGAPAPTRISKSVNNSTSLGISASSGNSNSLIDFQDMNGDRFPDVIGQGGVQFTLPTGGLSSATTAGVLGSARGSRNETFGVSTSSAGTITTAVAIAKGVVAPSGNKSAPSSSQGTDEPGLGIGGDASYGSSDSEYELIDINGDGLSDKVFENGTAALNLGYRFAAAEPWNAGIINNGESLGVGVNYGFNPWFYSLAGGLNLGIGTNRSDETYTDVNGDGLPDKVIAGSPFTVRLNTGSGYLAPIAWPGGHDKVAVDKHISLGGGVYFTYGYVIVPIPPLVRVVFNPGINHSVSMGRPEVTFQDMDGDGYADHLFSEKTNELKVAFNPIGRTNLLKKVTRPLGASFTLDYTRLGNTYPMPQSRWVMSKVEVTDGFTGDGPDRQLMTFQYKDGFYDRRERDFYGFKTVIAESRDTAANDALYRAVTRSFSNENYYEKGLLLSEKMTDAAGHAFTQTDNTYTLKDMDSGTVLTGVAKQSITATAFPQLTQTDKRFFEGGSQSKSTRTTFAYDDLGNVTGYSDFGDVGSDDDLVATITYHNLDALYVVSEPQSIVVRNAAGELLRRRESTLSSNGDLTELRRYLGNGAAITHNFTYYPNGNVNTVQRPANASGQRYTLTYSYDPEVATHVTSVSDSFAYVSGADYDLRWGAVTESRDLNAQKIQTAFDTFGRVSSISGPYELSGSQATLRFAYHPEATIPWALTQHYDEGRGDPLETVLFTDGLKRVLQTKKDGAVDAGGSGSANDAMIVSGRVIFDAFGRSVTQHHPVTEGLGSQGTFNAAYDSVAPTRTVFDVLDREVQTTLPDNSVFRTAYDFGNDRNGQLQFRTTATDANNVKKERFTDIRGRQTALLEHNHKGGQPNLWTSYRYNAINELIQVKDDKNNLTSAEYDLLGRRTALQNPDAGREERVYDAASNLVSRSTSNLRARGVAIAYDYDFERLKATRYPLYPDNNVAYTYGGPNAAFNRAGRVAKVEDASGVEEFFYGALGETTKTTRTLISLTGRGAKTYTTQFRYDTWNRIREMTYPDGEVLTYGYNAGGLLKSISGRKGNDNYAYLNNLSYDKFEQRVFQALGNGTTMHYAYEPERRRLSQLQSANSQRTFMDMRYGYDDMTNILELKNQAPAGTQPDSFGGLTTQTFDYDDLYRLTQANGHWTNWQGKQERYSLGLNYDTIHNLTKKTQSHERTPTGTNWLPEKKTSYDWAYAYGSAKPHAATHIGERSFGYDANGNQLGWDNDKNGQRRGMVWDEENRIRTLSDNGRTQTYIYDANGERVLKRGRQGETAYVNGYFVIRNGAVASKHVFNGSQRIATKLVMQESQTIPDTNGNGNNNGVGNGNTPPGWIKHGKTSNPGANFPSAQDHAQQVASATPYDSANNGGTVYEAKQYFYHPDHVGSNGFVTDANGAVFEHTEYFAFGETWAQEHSNTERTPYLFTGKELDEETQLYYFGARYYDPRTSQWQSVDPILDKYMSGETNGGVFNSNNLGLYTYSYNNPINLYDPNGKETVLVIWATTPETGVGHAAAAINTGKMDENGKALYRYTDLWPGGAGADGKNFYKDVAASYNDKVTTLDNIINTDVSGGEGRAPDGIISINTTMEQDANALRVADESMKGDKYNGLRRNCSDFAKSILNAVLGAPVQGQESFKKVNFTTPNKLFKDVAGSGGATVLKDPGSKVDNEFAPTTVGPTRLRLLGDVLINRIHEYEGGKE